MGDSRVMTRARHYRAPPGPWSREMRLVNCTCKQMSRDGRRGALSWY